MANNILKAKKQAIRHKILSLTGDDDRRRYLDEQSRNRERGPAVVYVIKF